MFLSGRESRTVLEAAGFSTWHSRKALSSGLAGDPVKTRSAHLYEEARVRDLAARPTIDWRVLNVLCPVGIFISRRDLDLTLPLPELLDQASSGWGAVNPFVLFLKVGRLIEQHGSLPFVATVAGVVVLGADIVGTRPGPGLRLVGPGAWFARIDGGRLPTGPDRPWVLTA